MPWWLTSKGRQERREREMLEKIRFKAEMNAAHTSGYQSVYDTEDKNIEVGEVTGIDWESAFNG